MDPEAVLRQAEEAARDGDVALVVDRLCAMCEWLAKGGFAPTRMTHRLGKLQDIVDARSAEAR